MPVSASATTASIRCVAGDDHADRLQPLAAEHRRHQHAQLLAFLDAAVAAARAEHLDDRADVIGRGAEIAQNGGDAVAFLGDDQLLVESDCRRSSALVVFGSNVMFSGTMRASKPA